MPSITSWFIQCAPFSQKLPYPLHWTKNWKKSNFICPEIFWIYSIKINTYKLTCTVQQGTCFTCTLLFEEIHTRTGMPLRDCSPWKTLCQASCGVDNHKGCKLPLCARFLSLLRLPVARLKELWGTEHKLWKHMQTWVWERDRFFHVFENGGQRMFGSWNFCNTTALWFLYVCCLHTQIKSMKVSLKYSSFSTALVFLLTFVPIFVIEQIFTAKQTEEGAKKKNFDD